MYPKEFNKVSTTLMLDVFLGPKIISCIGFSVFKLVNGIPKYGNMPNLELRNFI